MESGVSQEPHHQCLMMTASYASQTSRDDFDHLVVAVSGRTALAKRTEPVVHWRVHCSGVD